MKQLVFLVVLSATAYLDAVVSVALPSDFKKCDYSQLQDIKPCMRKNIEDAIHKLTKPYPDVGLPCLNPLEVPHYKIVINESNVAVVKNLSNVKITGYTNVQIKSLEVNFVGNIALVLNLFFPTFESKGDYEIKGEVLGKAIEGEGYYVLRLDRLKANQTFYFEETLDENNIIQSKVVKSELILDPENGHIDLQNLFGGDKIKGYEMNKALNDNFLAIFNASKSDAEKVYAEIHKGIFNGFLQKVSATEVFENYKT